jgi:hypothetical protein
VRQLLLKIFLFPFAVGLSFISFSGCEKKYDTVVDSVGIAPVVSDARFSLSVINTDTINIGTVRSPDDQLTIRGVASVRVIYSEGTTEIKTVQCSVTKDPSSSSLGDGALHDDGIPPDQIANDSVYSGYVNFKINRADVGGYWITFWSENRSGYIHSQDQHYQSNIILLPLQIVRFNHAPILSNLQADTLVSLGGVDHVLQLRITVSDSDGQSDIRMVFFNSFKPDGSPSSGNPQSMYDDGNANQISGDLIAGDGIYGLKISLPKTTTIGTYRFEFQAMDRSFDYSNVIIKNIVIKK